jgi:hypothetical protein
MKDLPPFLIFPARISLAVSCCKSIDSLYLLKGDADFAPVLKFENCRFLTLALPLIVDLFAIEAQLQTIQNQFVCCHRFFL